MVTSQSLTYLLIFVVWLPLLTLTLATVRFYFSFILIDS